MKIDIRSKATSLRKRGYSYSEIADKLQISKSTCSIWLNGIILDDKARLRLHEAGISGRRKGTAANVARAQRQIEEIQTRVRDEMTVSLKKPIQTKLACALLYWGEGNKVDKSVAFTNSDPVMVQTFVTLLRSSFPLVESKWQATIHLHEYHNERLQKRFWSNITGIPLDKIGIYKKPNSGQNIRVGYPGCITVRYHSRVIFYELEAYYKTYGSLMGA